MSRILIINGNPKPRSFCWALAQRYQQVAAAGHDVQLVNIAELNFDANLQHGYDQIQPLEPDLETLQQQIRWAEHLVLLTPLWWGGMPALLKGLFDRVFLPGYAFKYTEGKSWPKQLLKGRSAELIITMDTPVWWYKWFQGNPLVKQLKHTILEFVGIKVTSVCYLGPVMGASEQQLQRWLDDIERRVPQPDSAAKLS